MDFKIWKNVVSVFCTVTFIRERTEQQLNRFWQERGSPWEKQLKEPVGQITLEHLGLWSNIEEEMIV
jgi:hypothetical protein